MWYAINIKYSQNDSKVHFAVGLVYAKNNQEAMQKGYKLFAGHEIEEVKLLPLSDDYMNRLKTAYGGGVIARFEEYVE